MEYIDRVTRRLKLQNLRVLDAVVRSGSMARAAERLAVSQPVISKVISDLEHVLGVSLPARPVRAGGMGRARAFGKRYAGVASTG